LREIADDASSPPSPACVANAAECSPPRRQSVRGGRPQRRADEEPLLDRGGRSYRPKDYWNDRRAAWLTRRAHTPTPTVAWEKIDERTLPSNLGGHLALVPAMLSTDKERREDGRNCSTSPGCWARPLVEEAALRREIFSRREPQCRQISIFLVGIRVLVRTIRSTPRIRQRSPLRFNSLGLSKGFVPQLVRDRRVHTRVTRRNQRQLLTRRPPAPAVVQGKRRRPLRGRKA